VNMLQRPDKPDFQRFLTAIRGGCPDRVPVAEAAVHNATKAAILGRPIRSLADDVAFWEKAGYDFVCLFSGILDPALSLSAERRLGARDDRYDKAPTEREWSHKETGQIASMTDFQAYPWPSVDDLVPAHLTDVAQYLPGGMKVIAMTGKIFTATWQLMGFESFGLAIYDSPELVEAIFDRVTRLQVAGYERICDLETIGGLWFSDDVAHSDGPLVSPKILRKYLFPAYTRMVNMAHEAGKIAIYHSDGRLWRFLDDIMACGFDALHPIEPKAMDIVETRQRTQGKLSLIGNIDLDFPLTRGSPEDVRTQVRERIAALAPAGGYLVGSSNSIPDWVPVQNYVAMLQAVFDLGRYPIALS